MRQFRHLTVCANINGCLSDACADLSGLAKLWDKKCMVNLLGKTKSENRNCIRAPRGMVVLFFALVFVLLSGIAHAANFTASLDRKAITLGESATLTLNFEGGSPARFPSLAIPNVRIIGQGKSQQFVYVNGQATTSISQTFALTPTQIGEYTVPPFSVEIGGQNFQSQPIKLTVTKPDPATAPKVGTLKLVIPKQEVYLGEIVPVDIQLNIFQNYAQKVQLSQPPRFKEEGFTLGKMLQPTQTGAVVDNQRVIVVSFKTFAVPAKVGNLNIGPATADVSVPRPDSRRTVFGEYVDWQPLTLEGEPQVLKVLPLPTENVPPGFSGAVGNYSLTMSVSPTNIAVGDPVTIKIQISGQGALESIRLPEQTDWNQFKVYPPTSEFQPADPAGQSGVKTFSLTAVPESTSVKELPQFKFAYFNPDLKLYQSLTQPATPLTVRPSAASLPPPPLAGSGSPTDSNQPPARDVVHIKPRLGAISLSQVSLIKRPWFLALQAIPLLTWIGFLIMRAQREKLENNPKLRRQRQVEQILRDGIKDLHSHAAANQPESFYALVFRLLQEQLGERLDLPAASITESVIEDRLRPKQVSEETLSATHNLFQACNQARYARQSSNEQLISLIPTVEKTLNQLKTIPA